MFATVGMNRLARRLLPPERIDRDIRFSLSSDPRTRMDLRGELPLLEAYLHLTNLNPVDLVLDRLVIELSVSNLTVTWQSVIPRRIARLSDRNVIFLRRALGANERAYIAARVTNGELGASLGIKVRAVFRANAGEIIIERDLAQNAVPCTA